jgi:hypothetical protein
MTAPAPDPDEVDELSSVLAAALASDPEARAGWRKAATS